MSVVLFNKSTSDFKPIYSATRKRTLGVSDRTLPFSVNLDWSTVNWVKQHRYTLTLNASKK